MDSMGFEHQQLVGVVFILIALLICGVNFICRFSDSHKYDTYEYTSGTVVRFNSSSSNEYSIDVEFYTDDSDEPFICHNSDVDYEFMRKGQKVRVYYDEDAPLRCFVTKKDLLTGLYLPAETNYYWALYAALLPTIIGVYLIADYRKARKLAIQGRLKPKKKVKSSKDPDYDPNLHELARMANYKRGWLPFWIGGISFYLFMTFASFMTIISVIRNHPEDSVSPVVFAIFVLVLSHGMLAGVIVSMSYLRKKKDAFIKGFMADEMTAVYDSREEAALILWKHVKKYMECEPFYSRFKLEYNRDWLETYEEHIEHLKKKEPKPVEVKQDQPERKLSAPKKKVPDNFDLNIDPEKIMALGFDISEGHCRYFLHMDNTPTKEQILDLLNLLSIREELSFWNFYYRSGSDPGAYVSAYVSGGKAIMMQANHGWSGGYISVSIDDLVELIIRNWDKDWDMKKQYVNAVSISKTFDPDRMAFWMENPTGTFVPDYTVTAW